MSIEVSSRLEADVLADETSVVADDELGPEEVEGADEEEYEKGGDITWLDALKKTKNYISQK